MSLNEITLAPFITISFIILVKRSFIILDSDVVFRILEIKTDNNEVYIFFSSLESDELTKSSNILVFELVLVTNSFIK